MKRIAALLPLLLLVGCSSGGGGRYSIKQDHGPSQAVDVTHVKDAVPRVEPKSRGGNKSPYVVFGKRYYILDNAQGYKARGGASWYGKKFHGHSTSNGEKYDMYAMTAAHKSLPIPTYVRVTNLKNSRQVIVRVNDRGPFHQGRIIDLSYAAASKLDMLRSGTAQVEVEVIDPRSWQRPSNVIAVAKPVVPAASAPLVRVPVRAGVGETSKSVVGTGHYLQVGAYSNRVAAERVTATVRALTGQTVVIRNLNREGGVLYRVQVGPVSSDAQLRDLIGQLEGSGYPDAHLVDLD